MFANLNYLLLIVLIVLKRHLVDGQENSHEHSYEEMDPDSREEQLYRSKNGGFTDEELNAPLNSGASKSNSPTPAPDEESSYENQMPQQAAKTGKENGPNIANNHHADTGAFPHPVFNPYLTFNPYMNQPETHPLAMFRQVSPFVPMQAQASYGSYDQLPGYGPPPPSYHQSAMFNPLFYPPQPMYDPQMQHLPFANHGDQLRNLLAANQPIITFTPIDDKMMEHVPYNDRSFGHKRPKKSHSRMLDEHNSLYGFEQ